MLVEKVVGYGYGRCKMVLVGYLVNVVQIARQDSKNLCSRLGEES